MLRLGFALLIGGCLGLGMLIATSCEGYELYFMNGKGLGCEDVEALMREHYRWWTVNASRKHLKLGPIAFSFDQEFAICLWCRWTIGVIRG